MFPCDCAIRKWKYNKKGITYFGSRKDNLFGMCVLYTIEKSTESESFEMSFDVSLCTMTIICNTFETSMTKTFIGRKINLEMLNCEPKHLEYNEIKFSI